MRYGCGNKCTNSTSDGSNGNDTRRTRGFPSAISVQYRENENRQTARQPRCGALEPLGTVCHNSPLGNGRQGIGTSWTDSFSLGAAVLSRQFPATVFLRVLLHAPHSEYITDKRNHSPEAPSVGDGS